MLATCCLNEAPSGPARGPLGGGTAGVGTRPDKQRLPVGTSQPPRAQESDTQSPPWVALSFIQGRRQCGEQGAPSQEPVNRSWGRVGSETRRGECVRSEVWQGPLPALRDPQRGWWPGAQGWPGAEGHPQASGAP